MSPSIVLAIVLGLLLSQRGTSPISVLSAGDYHSLAFNPTEADVVFFGHHDGVMLSEDGGVTWRNVVARRNFDAMAIAVDFKDSRLVYAAGHDVFPASRDGGTTWSPVPHNLPGSDIHGFAVSSRDPKRLFAFVVGYGLFVSDDGGSAWTRLSTQLPADVMALAASGSSPETLYAARMRAGVLKSTDGATLG
ncbi:MAG: hypothetical protein HYX84_08400 [Chloroflexi bacterium]|nr:hypothetical protein [Chloroflexota bacterium]